MRASARSGFPAAAKPPAAAPPPTPAGGLAIERYSSLAAAFGLPVLAFLAADFLRLASSAGEHLLLDQRNRPAGTLDCRFRARRGVIDRQRQLGLQLAAAQDAHAVERTADDARGHQRASVYRLAGIDQAGVHRRLQAPERHLVEDLAVALVEAALGQAPMQRHLPALEPAEADAGAGGLALAAAAGLLAHAGADAAADAHAHLARSGIVLELVEAHLGSLLPPSVPFSSLVVDHPHEVADLLDHAAHGRRILERAPAAHLVEAETDQRLLLDPGPPVRACDLLHRNRLAGLGSSCLPACSAAIAHHLASAASPAASASPAEPSRRRATISLTFLPRRAATARGFSCPLSASKVARTML